MAEQDVWRASLGSLRSRFERAASDFVGVRCSLTREPFESGGCPVNAAAFNDHFSFEGLRPIIAAQSDGIISIRAGQTARDNHIYTWWFVHDRLLRARSSGRVIPGYGLEIDGEARRASDCEQRFQELAEEGGRLLKYLPNRPTLVTMLGAEPIYEAQLWLVFVLNTARRRPDGTSLRTSVTLPGIVEVDIIAATGRGELPNSVILNLEGNPFSASVATIDLMLGADTKTDKPKKSKKVLPRSSDVLKAIKFVTEQRRLMAIGEIPTANLRAILSDYASSDMKRVERLARQLQPSRYGWMLKISDDAH